MLSAQVLLVVLLPLVSVLAKPVAKDANCGYASCPAYEANSLNVHVIPHSHDDVGWLKTVDQYYYGSRTDIQRGGVQFIIDSVILALNQNPDRRFIQVETAFFHKWWNKQNEEKRSEVRRLLENGQLEFLGGAWSMNDEAAAHYHSIIDQFSFGLNILNETFGECGRPRVGWQIDPFGHSKEQASIFTGMGFDGVLFSRLDYRDKIKRFSTKTTDMIWQGSKSLGNDSNLFTSVMYNDYRPPQGYCFDIECTDDPIIDDETSPAYNFLEKVEGYADFIRTEAPNYPTNNILITMGEDFHYQDALSNFFNMDKLLNGFKIFKQTYEGKPINVFYSTPSCYVAAVNKAATINKQAFAVKTDDFFPYASDPHAYWTGYFTSRPTSKRFERQANNYLQILKQLAAHQTNTDSDEAIFQLEDAVGVMQHHDAITGTEKQHVADDYARIVDQAISKAESQIDAQISKLLNKNQQADFKLELKNCLLSNVSVCPQSLENKFLVAVYNPLSRPIDTFVRLPVNSLNYKVVGPKGETIDNQIVPSIIDFNLGDLNHAKYELVFKAVQVSAQGVAIYFVTKTNSKKNKLNPVKTKDRFKLGNEIFGFELDTNGLLKNAIINGRDVKVEQRLMYYIGALGNNSGVENRASGAYIFRPVTEALNFTDPVTFEVFKGDLVEEVHQTFSNWAKQIIRIYAGSDHIEFDWLVGPIDVSDNKPKEIISRFITDLNSGDKFYTDSNGREMVERVKNFRSTYEYSDEEPISGNYYPITTRISIKDDVEVNILTDRAQGGTSLQSGEIELMLHRRLINDDAKGVGEALDEQQYGKGMLARGTHYLIVNGKDYGPVDNVKALQQEKTLAAWTFVSNKYTKEELDNKIDFEYSGITGSLPKNVQVLTLQPRANKILLRLEHIYEKDEESNLAQEATVNIKNLFNGIGVVALKETTLGANQWLEDKTGFDWILGDDLENADYSVNLDLGRNPLVREKRIQNRDDFDVTLRPHEIRTFILDVER